MIAPLPDRETCQNCGHGLQTHFTDMDSKGMFSFCVLQNCSCFISDTKED